MAEEIRNAQAEREKYVLAFNDTMLKIWREQITLLDVIDTGRLLRSPKSVAVHADSRFIELVAHYRRQISKIQPLITLPVL